MSQQRDNAKPERERGVSLVLVALGLVMLLALAGLAVDLATMYVARNEAQKSADAAALAGAKEFVANGATIGLTAGSTAATEAAQQAVLAGNANLVIGRNPNLDTSHFNSSCSGWSASAGVSGGCFDFSTENDPRITVVVQQNIPTFFMKIFGITSVPVSATATAEAYNPMGATGPTSTAQCLKPWLTPNCDYDHLTDATGPVGYEANAACPQTTQQQSANEYAAFFVYPDSQPAVTAPNQPAIPTSDLGQVVMPSLASYNSSGTNTGGSIGEYLQIKPGSPQAAPAPSQFYPVFLPETNPVFECPSCGTADRQSSTTDSAARYREFIECCSTGGTSCGSATVSPIYGDMVGPTAQGVQCLIHEGTSGSGQDTISFQNQTDPTIPYTMYSGANNPYPYAQPPGSVITTSDSIVTVPLYNGATLCPGGSSTTACPSTETVTVQGMLQLFIAKVGGQQDSVYAYVLTISGCGGTDENGSGGSGTPVPSASGSPIPVRLIHQ